VRWPRLIDLTWVWSIEIDEEINEEIDGGLVVQGKLPISALERGMFMSEIAALIVDDSSVMRKIVERALRQAGLPLSKVHEASSGVEALDLLKSERVQLILSDINMPMMDGLEFLRQLRSQDLAPDVPVVMITTESSEEHVKEAIVAGAQGYIRKPFTAEQVKDRVLPLLDLA
jgi:two-component system, chemotaxis family, chemotaxis protein CheY